MHTAPAVRICDDDSSEWNGVRNVRVCMCVGVTDGGLCAWGNVRAQRRVVRVASVRGHPQTRVYAPPFRPSGIKVNEANRVYSNGLRTFGILSCRTPL